MNRCPNFVYKDMLNPCIKFCSFCEKKSIKIPEGFETCKECKGTGFSDDEKGGCPICDKTGLVSWTEKITKGN